MPDDSRTVVSSPTEPDPSAATRTAAPTPPGTDPGAATRTSVGSREVPVVDLPSDAPPGYVFERELGHGAMGVVYQARQVRLNRAAAVKLPLSGRADTRALIRFLAEAEAVAAIHHPHVVQVYEFGEHDGRPFLALEFLSGGSLADRTKGRKPMPTADAARLVAKLADGVQAAHARGIVHRDLKPANILFDEYGEPKVTDFGLAKRGGGTDLTATQAVMGTPAYMAPEQASGDTKFVGPAADVYALGVILYECLAGGRPHDHTDTMALLRMVAETEPTRLRRRRPDAPRDLELICHKCLEKVPHRRYATAGELADDLRRYLAGEPVLARPRPAAERFVRWVRRHPTSAAIAACVAIAAGGLAAASAAHNARLQTALTDARSGWAAAEDERRAAEDERKAVVRLMADREHQFDVMLDGFDTRLENLDGMEAVHREFMADQAATAERMLAATPDDPAALARAANVSRRAADAIVGARDYPAADRQYARAAELYDRLIARDDAPEHRQARARLAFGWGWALQAAGRRSDAAAQYADAAARFDPLSAVAGLPVDARPAVRAARAKHYLAEVTAADGRVADAVPVYRDALARQTALMEKDPTDADLLEDLGRTASGLGLALEATDPAAAEAAHRRAIAAFKDALAAERIAEEKATNRKAKDEEVGTAAGRRMRRSLSDAYHDLALLLEARDRDTDLLALAREYRAAPLAASENTAYNAACFAGRAVGVARKNWRPTDALAAAACDLLKQAVAAGFRDRTHLAVDADMDPIRGELAFKVILGMLNKNAVRPPTGTEMAETLRDLHDSRLRQEAQAKSAAVGYTTLRRATRTGWDFKTLAGYALKTATATSDSTVAVPLFAWVAEAAGDATAPAADLARFKRDAIEGLRPHVRKEEFVDVCRVLGRSGNADVDELLAAAADEQSGQETAVGRGRAAYNLAVSKARQAELAPVGTPEQKKLLDEAEKQFARVASEFKGVSFGTINLAAIAEQRRYEVAHLYPGRPAPPIRGAGLDGGPAMDVAEHRGKVVLVTFWANWCGYCRAMFPAQRALVTAHADKAFVVIGVNADRDRQAATRAVANNKLNWRSVYEGVGGPVCDAYRIEGYPCFYLLDGNGVIRKRWEGRPKEGELERAVSDLLAERPR